MSGLDLALLLAAAPVTAAAAYLAWLALVARPGSDLPLAAGTTTHAGARRPTFDVIVPAHDEEAGIAATVASLRALDYPRASYRVVVVADNCVDRTAERARRAGATVLERHDAARRGKGYALAHAFEASLAAGCADAVVVVDADSVVSPNLLAAFAARIERGAEAVQAEYGVRNPTASWRTRLMVVALTLFHTLRSLARERLRLSSGLRGNGMCFTHALLRRVPHRAVSVVEDVEYGVALGLAGVRVVHAGEACVLGEMPATARASGSQRERWEGGRWALARRHVPALVRASVARRDPVPLDLALDLLVPPLTTLALASGAGTAVALLAFLRGAAGGAAVACWAASLLGILVYVGRGIALSGLGARALLDLLWAPLYAAWKLSLLVRPRRARGAEWVRTARASEAAAARSAPPA